MFPTSSNIVVVDDSAISRSATKNVLRDLGFWKIQDFESVREAKAHFSEASHKKNPTHLLIVDLHMPDLMGDQLIRWLREQEGLSKMPVIVVTSSQDTADVIRVAALGISHFILKPITPESLRERLATTWDKQGRSYVQSLT